MRKRRKSIRQPGHDYANPGAYFITIATKNRAEVLGDVAAGRVHLSGAGVIVRDCWKRLPLKYPSVALDSFIVMPDHLHGILRLKYRTSGRREEASFGPQSGSIGSIIRGYKAGVQKEVGHTIRPLWQRGCHDRVIRTPDELRRARIYIQQNPFNWKQDQMA